MTMGHLTFTLGTYDQSRGLQWRWSERDRTHYADGPHGSRYAAYQRLGRWYAFVWKRGLTEPGMWLDSGGLEHASRVAGGLPGPASRNPPFHATLQEAQGAASGHATNVHYGNRPSRVAGLEGLDGLTFTLGTYSPARGLQWHIEGHTPPPPLQHQKHRQWAWGPNTTPVGREHHGIYTCWMHGRDWVAIYSAPGGPRFNYLDAEGHEHPAVLATRPRFRTMEEARAAAEKHAQALYHGTRRGRATPVGGLDGLGTIRGNVPRVYEPSFPAIWDAVAVYPPEQAWGQMLDAAGRAISWPNARMHFAASWWNAKFRGDLERQKIEHTMFAAASTIQGRKDLEKIVREQME
jgi:hypothetical protein